MQNSPSMTSGLEVGDSVKPDKIKTSLPLKQLGSKGKGCVVNDEELDK